MRRPRFMGASKYHSSKINSADGRFDSGLEYKRWIYLKTLEQEGEIKNLVRQVPYTLIPSQYKDGKCVYRECKYVADFVYSDNNGVEHIEDTKGFITEVFKLKEKLFFYVYGKKIEIVKKW